jgi:hypothetical protein
VTRKRRVVPWQAGRVFADRVEALRVAHRAPLALRLSQTDPLKIRYIDIPIAIAEGPRASGQMEKNYIRLCTIEAGQSCPQASSFATLAGRRLFAKRASTCAALIVANYVE